MTQTVILAPAATTATSTTVTVGLTGVPVNIYIYSTSPLTNNVSLPVLINGPASTTVQVGALTRLQPNIILTAPGAYVVQRNISQIDGLPVGVALEQ